MERRTAWATDGVAQGQTGQCTVVHCVKLSVISGSDKLDKKQTYTKTEAYKLYYRVY